MTGLPCVVGWSAVSPLGVGRRAFADGLLAGATPEVGAARGVRPVGYPLAGSDPPALIGTRGTRTLDRLTTMVIASSTLVLDEYVPAGRDRSGIGLVLGTNTGSVDSIAGFLRDTFVRERPYLVDPGAFPNTVMNSAAGRTAIWHGLKGLNSTVAGGHNTGLATLRYAGRMIRRGYADTLLVGGVEELSGPVALAADRLHADGPAVGSAGRPMGEGCVFFLVESAATAAREGRRPLAGLVDFESAVVARGDRDELAAGLAEVITTLLGRAGVEPSAVWRVSLGLSGDPVLDGAETDGVDRVFGAAAADRRIAVSRCVGNTFSALGAFQLAAALAVAESDGEGVGDRMTVLTSVGSDGTVGCALIML